MRDLIRLVAVAGIVLSGGLDLRCHGQLGQPNPAPWVEPACVVIQGETLTLTALPAPNWWNDWCGYGFVLNGVYDWYTPTNYFYFPTNKPTLVLTNMQPEQSGNYYYATTYGNPFYPSCPSSPTSLVFSDPVFVEVAECTVRWNNGVIGSFVNSLNWQPFTTPGAGDAVVMRNTNSPGAQIVMEGTPVIAGIRSVRRMFLGCGNWDFDLTNWPPEEITNAWSLRISDTLTVSAGARLTLDGPETNAPSTFRTPNLILRPGSELGFKRRTIMVESNFVLNATSDLNVRLYAEGRNHAQPLLSVSNVFLAGGRLNLIPSGFTPQQGDRFRLVEFSASTNDVGELYRRHCFTNYTANLSADLFWGLVLTHNTNTGRHTLEAVVVPKPRRAVQGTPLSPTAGRTNWVLVTHGALGSIGATNQGGLGELAHGIQSFLTGAGNATWDVVTLDWSSLATTNQTRFELNSSSSAELAVGLAQSLMHWLRQSQFNYKRMHLVTHGAGAWMGNRLMQIATNTAVHLTLLDAFGSPANPSAFWWPDTGNFSGQLGTGGQPDDFVEQYYDRNLASPIGTHSALPHAVNFDLTRASTPYPPYHTPDTWPCLNLDLAEREACLLALSPAAHAWPIEWYLATVKFANLTNLAYAFPGVFCGGFLLSPEFLQTTQSQLEYEFMREYRTNLSMGEIEIGSGCNRKTSTTGLAYGADIITVQFGEQGSYNNPPSGGVEMLTGSGASGQWAAVTNELNLIHSVGELKFSFQFTDVPSILTVLINGQPVWVVLQSLSGPGLVAATIPFDNLLPRGTHEVVFLLETTSPTSAGITVGSMQVVFDPRPEFSQPEFVSQNEIRYRFYAPPGRHYSLMSATNIPGDWTVIGNLFVDANGSAEWTETNLTTRAAYYRLAAILPRITSPPQSLSLLSGETASFSVGFEGTPPLTLQWQRGGVSLPGLTNATATIPGVTTNDAGVYTVVVANDHGVVASPPATLTVTPPQPPTITTHPLGATIPGGMDWQLSVLATGTAPLHYQWRKNGTPLTGATNSNYQLVNPETPDSGLYSVVVTNAYGSRTSFTATVTVTMSLAEALDTTDITWTTDALRPWFGQTTYKYDGQDAAQSPNLFGSGDETWLQATVVGPGQLSFWWRVESTGPEDRIQVNLDGVPVGAAHYYSFWNQETIAIPAGMHSVRWIFSKGFSIGFGSAWANVDQVTFIED